MEPKILHLTLTKQWFDMIASGEKKEEYREIKPYWEKRLVVPHESEDGDFEPHFVVFKTFDVIQFKNGYSKYAPQMAVECKGIAIDFGMASWGAPVNRQVFIIQLGNIIALTR